MTSAGAPSRFDYLVVIDFEATCDEGPRPKVTRATQEIIEFPIVAFNQELNDVEFFEQIFVKPEWSQELTPFCTHLTSITTEILQEKGVLLRDAIQQFDAIVRDRITSRGKTFCIVTDGDWDLKLLIRESKAKGIPLEKHFLSFIDIKREFSRVIQDKPNARGGFGSSSFVSFRQMMSLLELPHIGHHHLGVDDAKNMAGIVKELLARSGRCFELTSVISLEEYDPDRLDPDYVDFNRTPFPLAGGDSDDESDRLVLFIRGLPWAATEKDLIEFFAGIPLSDVLVVREKNSKRSTGTAFVAFQSADDLPNAWSKNGGFIQNRYLEFFRSNRRDLNQALSQSQAQAQAQAPAQQDIMHRANNK